MRILIAEDNPDISALLELTLSDAGYQPIVMTDGEETWELLQRGDAPRLMILDWMMPGISGVEICRRVRTLPSRIKPYILLLTARGATVDIVEGLRAGVNDYLTKPFNEDELLARLQSGATIVELQRILVERVGELEAALAEVKHLRGILPICSYCKRIRDDQNYWEQVESYVGKHTEAQFSHSICPDCYTGRVMPELKDMKNNRR